MTDLNTIVSELGEEIRFLKKELHKLQVSSTHDLRNKKIHISTLTNPTLVTPTADEITVTGDIVGDTLDIGGGDATIDADGNWVCPYAEVTEVQTATVTIENPDAGVDQTLTASGVADEETITFSNDVTVNTGHFISNSVYIGDQKLSEDGELVITDPVTPGIYIKDTGDAGVDAVGQLTFLDSAAAGLMGFSMSSLVATWTCHQGDIIISAPTAGKKIEFYINADTQLRLTENLLIPVTNNILDLGSDAKEFKDIWIDGVGYFDQLNMHGQINFASGTTYKVEADGDAVLKGLILKDNCYIDADNKYLGVGDSIDFYMLHDGTDSLLANNTGIMKLTNAGRNINLTGAQVHNFLSGTFNIRDSDDGNAFLFLLDTSARTFNIGSGTDSVDIYTDGAQGVSGTFKDFDENVITVTNGLITNLTT